ncbi:AAA family ATPase [beta proteobacterium MWH-UniP1]
MLLTFPTKNLAIQKAYLEPFFDVAILIGNHRSLADWNLIPLSKITTILGPNSAGKSSIYEAFEILSFLTRAQSRGSTELATIKDSARSQEIAPAYGISAKYPTDLGNLWEYLSFAEERLDRRIHTASGEKSLLADLAVKGEFPVFGNFFRSKEFQAHISDTVFTAVFENIGYSTLSLSVYLDGNLAATWTAEDGHQHINVKSFALSLFMPESVELKNLFDEHADFQYNFYYSDWSSQAPEIGPAWPSFGSVANFMFQLTPYESNDPRLADEAFALITAIFHYPLATLIQRYAWTFNSDPVRDLNSDWFFCKLNPHPDSEKLATHQFADPNQQTGTSGKHVLAREAIFQNVARLSDPSRPKSRVLTQINEWLGGKAFLDSGYQIKVDLKTCIPFTDTTLKNSGLIDIKDVFEIRENKVSNEEHQQLDIVQLKKNVEFLARIFLVDLSGRELRFSEVGTGFSQILPILTFLGISNNYVIRQPEVHLHPKLQSRVADCIVNCVANDRKSKYSGNIIIETHSEHLILRLLRRIRNSHKDELLHTSLTLYPDELSLIYIRPMGDRSQVFLVRVNSAGEFIDGWPEGFFDERDEDLWN